MRGQTAVESLFLLLLIITSTIFIIGLYSQTHDGTVGLSIVRTEITSIANSMDKIVLIKKVSLDKLSTGETFFVIRTDPNNLKKEDFGQDNLDKITAKVMKSTRLTNIDYNIN